MKTRVSIVLLLMLMTFSAIYASEDTGEMNENEAKKLELQRLQTIFETSTNATGEVKYDSSNHNWSYFSGKFRDINSITQNDSIYARQIFDDILDRILPFTLAQKAHLSKHKVIFNSSSITTVYRQSANGYRVVNGGSISMAYWSEESRFSIGNSTVEIPEGAPEINITKEQAIDIVFNKQTEDFVIADARRLTRLVYACNWETTTKQAFLCYVVPDREYNIYVDARTGIISMRLVGTMHTTGGFIKGTVYNTDYGIGEPTLINEDVALAGVYFSTNSVTGHSQSNGYFEIDEIDYNGLTSTLKDVNITIKDYLTQATIGSCAPSINNNIISILYPNDGNVKLSIYNLKGQKVVDIVDGTLAAGSHQAIWHGKDSQGRSVASGIYFTPLEQGKSSKVHKMVLMK